MHTMPQTHVDKDTRRAQVFELMRQKTQAESTGARIRRLAQRSISPDEMERIKADALRSLQAGL